MRNLSLEIKVKERRKFIFIVIFYLLLFIPTYFGDIESKLDLIGPISMLYFCVNDMGNIIYKLPADHGFRTFGKMQSKLQSNTMFYIDVIALTYILSLIFYGDQAIVLL